MSFSAKKSPIYLEDYLKGESITPLIIPIVSIIYIFRLLSPISWGMAFFQVKTEDGKFHSNRIAIEYFQLILTAIIALHFLLLSIWPQLFPFIASVIIGIIVSAEIIQYQIRTLVLRPYFDKSYKSYSHGRTYIMIMYQYVQVVFCYAGIYLHSPISTFLISSKDQMPNTHMPILLSIELSIITITTVGFGSIAPNPGSIQAIFVSVEALMGSFLFSSVIATALSRSRRVDEV